VPHPKQHAMERLNILIATVGLIDFPLYAAPKGAAGERHCIETPARYNCIPAALLSAIRSQEGGRVSGWHINSDHHSHTPSLNRAYGEQL